MQGILFFGVVILFDSCLLSLDQCAMMDEASEGSGSEGVVVVQDVPPISESAVNPSMNLKSPRDFLREHQYLGVMVGMRHRAGDVGAGRAGGGTPRETEKTGEQTRGGRAWLPKS